MSLSSAIHLARRLPPTETLGQRLGPSLKHEAECGHCSGAGEGEATPKQPWLVIAASSIGTLAILILTILVPDATMVCDPIAALLVELFPARIRYSLMPLPYHIGNGWFGGFLPTISFAIVAATGNIYSGQWDPIGEQRVKCRNGDGLVVRGENGEREQSQGTGSPLRCGIVDREDLRVQSAVRQGGGGALRASKREGVLVLADELKLLGDIRSRARHVSSPREPRSA
jgi:hypothetical protein